MSETAASSERPVVIGYHHYGIVVKDTARAMAFYDQVLHLPRIQRPGFNFPGAWYAVGVGQQLHLQQFDEPVPRTHQHMALEVADILVVHRALQTFGATILSAPSHRDDGSWFMVCEDPDGNRIELTQHS